MRRKLSYLAVLIVTLTLGLCAQIAWVAFSLDHPGNGPGTVEPDYELTGLYTPAEEFPITFDNVRRFDLTTASFAVDSATSAVVRTPIARFGYLVTDFDIFRMSNVELSNGRLSFTTQSHAGVNYQFSGRVLASNLYPVKGYAQYHIARTIMVEGPLVRMLFGVKIAEEEVRFTKGNGC
jgi:hypothetical protein